MLNKITVCIKEFLKMDLLIITGLSGSGKTRTLNALEDIGYYCMDNMPPALISKFCELLTSSEAVFKKVAIMCDIRGGVLFDDFLVQLDHLKANEVSYKLLYIDCDFRTLVTRFKETRRKHPLIDQANHSIEEAVSLEFKFLADIKGRADYVINTSLLSPIQLKQHINSLFLDNLSSSITVTCVSFGSKHGALTDADLMFDVRCLENPFYIEELKPKTGLDREVNEFVMSFDTSQTLFNKITDLIDFLLPLYIKEGKSQLVVAFGCTGGKHRSVTFAQNLYLYLKEKDIRAVVNHRDLTK